MRRQLAWCATLILLTLGESKKDWAPQQRQMVSSGARRAQIPVTDTERERGPYQYHDITYRAKNDEDNLSANGR